MQHLLHNLPILFHQPSNSCWTVVCGDIAGPLPFEVDSLCLKQQKQSPNRSHPAACMPFSPAKPPLALSSGAVPAGGFSFFPREPRERHQTSCVSRGAPPGFD